MPSTLPGSFASAVAGSNSDASARASSRADPGAFGDWNRRSNGATQTFRRSSTANALSSQMNQRDSSDSNSNAAASGAYVPPHISASRNGPTLDTRYSKNQLLDLFREQKDTGDLEADLADLYVGETLPGMSNGVFTAKWVKRDDSKHDYNAPGPEICWERNAVIEPLALGDMTDEEKELFTTSVNSPLKGPNQSGGRDVAPREGALARKSSISHTQTAVTHGFGLSSPTAARSANRRRDTNESSPFPRDWLASPSAPGASFREDTSETTPSFGLLHRRNDPLEVGSDHYIAEEQEKDTGESNISGIGSSFGSFGRSVTNPLGPGSSEGASNWPTASQNSTMSAFGAFGSLGFSSQTSAPGAKKPDSGSSWESRFRGLMNNAKAQENAGGPEEKRSIGNVRNTEEGVLRPDSDMDDESTFERPTNDYADTPPAEKAFFRAAALGGRTHDMSRFIGPQASFNTSARQRVEDEQRPGDLEAMLDSTTPVGNDDARSHDRPSGLSFHGYYQPIGAQDQPLSPAFTNPHSSPQQANTGPRDVRLDGLDMSSLHLPGLGEYQKQAIHGSLAPGSFGARRDSNVAPSYDLRHLDRGQFSSSGANRNFQPLGGLGSLGGFGIPEPWSATVGTGTPLREKATFIDLGGQIGGSSAAVLSPNISGPDPGTIGRAGKLGSLFPTAMQEQMRNEHARGQKDDRTLPQASETPEGLTRTSGSRQDLDTHFRTGQAKFDEFSGGVDTGPAFLGPDTTLVGEHLNSPPSQLHSQQSAFNQSQQQYLPQPPGQRAVSVGTSSSNQPPAAQQKTMVMPDRIRWIYRDPQGNTQGPWSGLEMHDWYRAGFFSPELLVKKAEDADYEPLAQLIRRIGNSREPFLVPQIGIPGPPSSQSSSNWPSQTIVSSPSTTAAAAQPPFAGSFPSFGTTLTAEQQNALERRKQEEQYLMARQKEHLAQQQLHVRQMQGQHSVHPQQLQHHSSAQSLQSQPSYGSMTSPSGFQGSPPQDLNHLNTTIAGGFENSFRLGGGVGVGPAGSGVDNLGHILEEDPTALFERIGLEEDHHGVSENQRVVGRPQYQDPRSFEERTATMLSDRARLERQQIENDQLLQARDQGEDLATSEHLREFRELRGNYGGEVYSDSLEELPSQGNKRPSHEIQDNSQTLSGWHGLKKEAFSTGRQPEGTLSLTEQVQKAAISKQSSATSPWARTDATALETPPPQSASPLPAPAARRGRTNVADTLAAESISQSQSPAEETPTSSLAPWAKESTEAQKQPSLREIQEFEARKAAEEEEAALASRRAALERELASQPPPPAPGLPSSSTWGNNDSPLTGSAAISSPWVKPAVPKAAAVPNGPAKKSLQQIQAEEEAAARKKKASAANNASIASHVAGAAQAMSSGKRYADLAGKGVSPSPTSTGAWTTVGASGKPKAPLSAPGPPTTTLRTPSSTSATTSGIPPTRPKPTISGSKTSLATAKQTAQDELKKWATAELRPDLDKDIHVDEFVHTLLSFPSDTDMITEVIHQNSSTIDSRHFAEEFVRRRGLAEKGKTDSASGGGSHYHHQTSDAKSGGWNEVARKGSVVSANATKDEASGAFKIVAAKKKGKK